ncbi:integrase [Caballeronia mineralivorans PML1(12)]|jgi:integrase/recombinase XerD|uniref:Integrase n=1 Tax=Caballeronia mineralivorans PML1(12) TaxID=908627 RepID=A0A0J1D1N1_9BURK|nr:tyrosine-type recombinase/integrase [Caballeronia mineralivorans]KLU26561.1 integrase [Caballeronia mineralivorans PML1(12)]
MKNTDTLVGPLLQEFFLKHLMTHRNVSPQTLWSYRDAFRLLLQFIDTTMHIEPVALSLTHLSAAVILAFLDSLEKERNNAVRSRNARLAAVRSFFRWVAISRPDFAGLSTSILAIPTKRTDRRLICALSRPEIDAILGAPDLSTPCGRRDHAMLLTMYNTGARVSEITAMACSQVELGGHSSFVHLHGKGRKERCVPLWAATADALTKWMREQNAVPTSLLFTNYRGEQLTRNGVDCILKKAIAGGVNSCPSLSKKHISPHVVRHATATHLLQAGVDISVIALWLGHESIDTTHIYMESNLAHKEEALGRLQPAGQRMPRFHATDKVMAFLETL